MHILLNLKFEGLFQNFSENNMYWFKVFNFLLNSPPYPRIDKIIKVMQLIVTTWDWIFSNKVKVIGITCESRKVLLNVNSLTNFEHKIIWNNMKYLFVNNYIKHSSAKVHLKKPQKAKSFYIKNLNNYIKIHWNI